MTFWTKDAPAILIALSVVAVYAIPSAADGYRKFRRGREIAQQVQAEEQARKFLAESWTRAWQRSHQR